MPNSAGNLNTVNDVVGRTLSLLRQQQGPGANQAMVGYLKLSTINIQCAYRIYLKHLIMHLIVIIPLDGMSYNSHNQAVNSYSEMLKLMHYIWHQLLMALMRQLDILEKT